MRIVGMEIADPNDNDVHTIDLWYSEKRGAWLVERLDAQGRQIGLAHRCATQPEASACLDEWLRAHGETHLVALSPFDPVAKGSVNRGQKSASREAVG
jgi:hypothetical protein